MKRFIVILIVLMLAVPTSVNALLTVPLPPRLANSRGQALILSSLNETQPMGDYGTNAVWYLTHAGYNVTYLNDGQVTVDLILNGLNNYNIVIWRTDSFTWKHTTYWWVGEKVNDGVQDEYADDFAQGTLNANTGIVGLNTRFFTDHFGPKTWSGISLLMFLSSDGNAVAPMFVSFGVTSVIYCNGSISLEFGLIDDLTLQMIAYLTQGESVYTAVYDTVSPFNQYQEPKDPLDNTYTPPFWFIGDGSVIIASGIQAAPRIS
jgi:hypothetical protein